MALTDEEIQQVMAKRKEIIEQNEDTVFYIGTNENRKYYTIIEIKNETTQGIAFVPSDSEGKNLDYTQTSVVYLGTQVGLETVWVTPTDPILVPNESTRNAIKAREALSPQYNDMELFYKNAAEEVAKHNGTITNLSAYSQSGVPGVKIGAKYKVPQITTFVDWGGIGALNSGVFTKSELEYINSHTHSYSDSGKDLTSLDGGGGKIVYGKVFTAEGTHGINSPWGDHAPEFFHLKGNHLDIDWYYKKNMFATGMSEAQVRKIAKVKAQKAKETNLLDWGTWFDSTDPEVYVKEYLEKYGPFEPEPVDKVKLNNKTIMELHKKMGSVSGSKLISLREELVATVADNARLQGSLYQSEVDQKLAQAKESAENHISEVHEAAYQMAKSLSSSEVETLLSEFTLETCWDAGLETGTLEQSASYARKLSEIAEVLEAASGKIVALDKEQAALFGLSK